MRKIILILFAWSNLALAAVPAADSLLKALHSAKTESGKVNTLNALGMAFRMVNPDTSITLCTEALRLSEKCGFKKGEGCSYYMLGLCHYLKGDTNALGYYRKALAVWEDMETKPPVKTGIDEVRTFKCKTLCNMGNVFIALGDYPVALDYYLRALKLAESLNNKAEIARDLGNIGVVYSYEGDYSETLEYYLKALKLKQELGNKVEIAITSGNIGIVYFRKGEYSKALEYYLKAFAIDSALDNKNNMAAWLNNIGSVYNTRHEYEKALDYYRKALQIAEGTGNRKLMADNLGNIGSIYGTKKDYEKALGQFSRALELAKEIKDKNLIAINLGNIGTIHSFMKNYKQGEDYLKQAISLDENIGALDYIMEFEKSLSDLYVQSGQPSSALEHYIKYTAAKDSLNNLENTKRITQVQMNYEFEQKQEKLKAEEEKRDAVYNEKIQLERFRLWVIAGGLCFLLLTSLLLFNRAKLKQKNAYQAELNQLQKGQAAAVIEAQEQERKRIAEDLHDSLGHLLATLKLNLQALPADQQPQLQNSLQLIDQGSTEIRNIAFNLMPRALEEEGLIPELNDLADKIKRSSLFDIILQVHNMNDFTLDSQVKFNIYRIVQEAVSNVIKHADAKEINIQLTKEDNRLTIMIEDDGKGFKREELDTFGRGLRNITARAEWLEGNIAIDSSPGCGTTIVIDIPLK